MKLVKLTAILGVIGLSFLGVLFVLEVLPREQALDFAVKLSVIIIILGGMAFLVGLFSGKPKGPPPPNRPPGPSF